MSSYVAGVNPAIASVSSSSAVAGTAITITGTNFSTGATVKFGTTSATVSALTTTSISVTVPSINVGNYNIIVTNTDGLVSNTQTFNVTAAPPPPAGGGGGGVDPSILAAVIAEMSGEPEPETEFELQSSEVADPFTDIGGHWAESYIDNLRLTGAISGKSEGTFAPNAFLTRAELVKIVVNLYALEIPAELTTKPFSDVELDAWYAPYVAAAKNAGIIGGYSEGTFRPEQLVSRVEALKIVLEATGLTIVGGEMNFPDTERGQWYEKYVAFSALNGIVNGYANGNFGPADSITRAEFSKVAILTIELTDAQ
ncbi:S-layer homology domain-containing protein [Candidatus Gracilibacteria bacterium]|nr:S-layer homology domain-containing protein [Candidatus Gracilibacteria bacterium]MCF7897031.1 S-layer homology domain-containing protein [Candidatus Gracilibacteria bacterium]